MNEAEIMNVLYDALLDNRHAYEENCTEYWLARLFLIEEIIEKVKGKQHDIENTEVFI